MKLPIHTETSTMQPLKFGYGYVISSHPRVDIDYLYILGSVYQRCYYVMYKLALIPIPQTIHLLSQSIVLCSRERPIDGSCRQVTNISGSLLAPAPAISSLIQRLIAALSLLNALRARQGGWHLKTTFCIAFSFIDIVFLNSYFT